MLKNTFVIKDHKIKFMVFSVQVFQGQRFKFCLLNIYTQSEIMCFIDSFF